METTKNTNVTLENNVVALTGEIVSEGTYSHEVYGEKFYVYKLNMQRLSEQYDTIPLTISERLIDPKELSVGTRINVSGQFRSFNKHTENKNHLVLSVFVRELTLVDSEEKDSNSIMLKGYICKTPVYRKTPLGREICDLLVAVNRSYGKSDYIPSICWGRNAKYASTLEVGQEIAVYGRIQSREYQKKLAGEEFEKRVAYEISVSKIEAIN